jgi:uncharacterized protein YgiM (DUF1202 family)
MRTSYNKTHKEKVAAEPEVPKEPVMGKVYNCSRLNIRKEPSLDANVLCIVSEGDTLMIEDDRDGWSHVYTSAGIEGYAISNYIEEG